jgi:hypothetical protein
VGGGAMSSEAGLVPLWENWVDWRIAGNSFGYERSQFQIGKCWNVPANTLVGASGCCSSS